VWWLQAEGPNIQSNQLDANNLTPLMYAVLADSKQALEILINSGCRKELVRVPENNYLCVAALAKMCQVSNFFLFVCLPAD